MEWLNFIATELHKGFSPLFNPAHARRSQGDLRDRRLVDRLTWVDEQLAGKQYLMGDTFTVADAYLFTVASWAQARRRRHHALPNLRLYGARGRAPGGAGGDEGRRPAQVANSAQLRRGQQLAGVGLARRAEQRLGLALLDDSPSFMTITRCDIARTTARSWLMKT